MNLYKIAKIGVAVLSLIGVLLLVRVMTAGEDPVAIDSAANPFITFSVILLILATAIVVIFTIGNLIKHPKQLKSALLTLIVLGGLFALAYVIANGDAVTDKFGNVVKDGGEPGPISKRVGALLNYSYILGIIAVGAVILGSVKGLFSKS
ncbi:MAG: hypothetical protein ACI89R_000215 [Candidatus Azotimanducaceae bacterium]|jgi:lysylphosphatidylglycerol synthetase-like protein (DUF2156 family)